MQRIIVTIAILLGGAWMAYAQPNTVTTPPCDDPDCQAAKFLYFFCDPHTGAMTKKCSADPNNEPGLKMYKKSTPLVFCLNFSAANWGRVYVKDPSNPIEFYQTDIFVLRNLEQRIREAERRWAFLCPAQGPNPEYPYCCVQIQFSTSSRDVDGVPNAEAVTWTWPRNTSSPDGTICEYDCQTSRIVINQQPSHTRPNEDGAPRHFIYTEEQNIHAVSRTDDPSQYVYTSAYSVFLHEFGHWFGFGHEDDNTFPCQSHLNSIMHTGQEREWNRVRRDLTNDDICMFKKAYCCEQTKSTSSVDEEESIAGSDIFQIIPNPPLNNILSLALAEPIHDNSATLRILNMGGDIVMEKKIAKEEQHLSIDIASLANGMYMLEVLREGRGSAMKVLIQR